MKVQKSHARTEATVPNTITYITVLAFAEGAFRKTRVASYSLVGHKQQTAQRREAATQKCNV